MTDKLEITLVGLDGALAKVAAEPAVLLHALGGAIMVECEETMRVSKEQCPVESGNLRASGHVQPPEIEGDSVVVRSGYGGVASAYALRQHEDLSLHHPVGKAKFLEDPMNQRIQGMAQRVGQAVAAKVTAK